METELGQDRGSLVMELAVDQTTRVSHGKQGNNDAANIANEKNSIVFFFFFMNPSVWTCVFTFYYLQWGITWSQIYKAPLIFLHHSTLWTFGEATVQFIASNTSYRHQRWACLPWCKLYWVAKANVMPGCAARHWSSSSWRLYSTVRRCSSHLLDWMETQVILW